MALYEKHLQSEKYVAPKGKRVNLAICEHFKYKVGKRFWSKFQHGGTHDDVSANNSEKFYIPSAVLNTFPTSNKSCLKKFSIKTNIHL